MGRYSEIKNKELIEKKPYLTKKELSLLLEKKGKNLDKKITLLLRDEYLVPLKKGLYTTQIYRLKNKKKYEEFVANFLYYPSYLSLEYVLQKEGIIPEAVYVFTSITAKLTRIFKNKLGTFSYRKIKDGIFLGYSQEQFVENYKILTATKTKALFDYLYFYVFKTSFEQELTSDLRINWDRFTQGDFAEFSDYVKLSKSKKMQEIARIISKIIL